MASRQLGWPWARRASIPRGLGWGPRQIRTEEVGGVMMGQVGRGSGGGEGLRGWGEGVVGALSVGGQADGKQPWGPGWGGRELQAVGHLFSQHLPHPAPQSAHICFLSCTCPDAASGPQPEDHPLATSLAPGSVPEPSPAPAWRSLPASPLLHFVWPPCVFGLVGQGAGGREVGAFAWLLLYSTSLWPLCAQHCRCRLVPEGLWVSRGLGGLPEGLVSREP